MPDADDLTLAFLETHPAAAAKVTDGLAGRDVVALFERVPARVGGPVLAAMRPTSAARALEALDDRHVQALLSAVGAHYAIALLRQVPEPRRTRLLDGLSTTVAVASRILLGFPNDSVGGWVDPDVVALSPAATASEAVARLRASGGEQTHDVYVVDDENGLLGMVSLATLLRATEMATLAELMRKPPAVIAAMAPIAGVTAHRGWEQSTALPVVERGGRLIGLLRHTTLVRAQGAIRPNAGREGAETAVGLLALGYWEVVSGLAQALLSVLPPERRSAEGSE